MVQPIGGIALLRQRPGFGEVGPDAGPPGLFREISLGRKPTSRLSEDQDDPEEDLHDQADDI
jgi:hypothetical protein